MNGKTLSEMMSSNKHPHVDRFPFRRGRLRGVELPLDIAHQDACGLTDARLHRFAFRPRKDFVTTMKRGMSGLAMMK